MSPRTLIIAVLAASGIPSPVAAQAVDQDIRCLLASNVFSKAEKDPNRLKLAQASSLFYLGRIDARVPAARLKPMLLAQAKTMTPATIASTMNACAAHFTQTARTLEAAGQQQAPPPQKPTPAKPK